jgi:hypothetical protein
MNAIHMVIASPDIKLKVERERQGKDAPLPFL